MLALLCCSFQADRHPQQLPEATNTGQNVLGCRLNGKIIIASEIANDLSDAAAVHYNANARTGLIYIGASFASPRYELEMSFHYDGRPGTYPLAVAYPYVCFVYDYTGSVSANDTNTFRPDVATPGTITITDYHDGILAGTFSFDAVNKKGRRIHITDGRFDIAAQQD